MITVKDVEHVAKLARLELTEDEKVLYTKQLGDVLKYVDQMNEVDTSHVKPMTQVIDFVNVTTDGVPSGEDRLKVKKGYKVALYVQVMHENLKRKLQADRIIKSLSSGF